MGSDGASLDPRLAHILIDSAEMRCGACGGAFRVPHVDVTLHGALDESSSAYLECPHCHAAIRLTGIEDRTAPQDQGHWIATAQMTKPAGSHGTGWAEFRTADLAVAQEGPPRVAISRPAPHATLRSVPTRIERARWPLIAATVALLIAGVALSFIAASSERMTMLIASGALLVLGAAGATYIALRVIKDRRISIVAILAVIAVVAGSLIPATGAVQRCRSLSPGSDLSSCDLTGKDLSGRDLAGADLSGATLTDADLTDARLSGATLSGARLGGVDLSGADLTDADLSGTDLTGSNVVGLQASGADLHEADLRGADLTDADLSAADLSAADLSAADLTGASFSDGDLSAASLDSVAAAGTNFERADLSGSDLSEADLEGAILTDIQATDLDADGVSLRDAHLQGAVIVSSSLRNADLAAADLTDATIENTSLASAGAENAIFEGATLDGVSGDIDARAADLRDARLNGVDLQGSDLSGADLQGAELSNVDLRDAAVTGARLAGASIRTTDLRGTKGLTDRMLGDALGVPGSELSSAVVRFDLRFEGLGAITRALRGVPKGSGVPEAHAYSPSAAFHPLVVLGGGASGLGAVVDKASGVWSPPGLRFAELAATEKTTDQVIETCFYNVHPIDRHRAVLDVSLYSAKNGNLVAQRTFYGPPPRACQQTEFVSTWDLTGGPVNYKKDVLPWLKGIVNPVRGV